MCGITLTEQLHLVRIYNLNQCLLFAGPMAYGTSYCPVSRKKDFEEKGFAGKNKMSANKE